MLDRIHQLPGWLRLVRVGRVNMKDELNLEESYIEVSRPLVVVMAGLLGKIEGLARQDEALNEAGLPE